MRQLMGSILEMKWARRVVLVKVDFPTPSATICITEDGKLKTIKSKKKNYSNCKPSIKRGMPRT